MTFDIANRIARYRLFCTIISICIVVSYDIHNHGTRCHNFQPTIFHIERHIEVLVAVGELVECKIHVRDTHNRSGCGCRAREPDVRHIVQRAVGVHRITFHCFLVVVILPDRRVTRDNHLNIRFVDGQITVGHVEHYILKIRIGVLELAGSQAHRVSVDIRARRRGVAIEREVGLGVCR